MLLSTGEDRPAALFSYLFVLTAAAFWASLRMSFRWATWLAIVGPPILFAGWYGKFFDVTPPPEHPTVDAPIESLTGPYFALAHRAAPLIAVAAFFAEWVAVYVAARRRALATLWPLAILCAAALAAHAGFAALLFDRPVVLGAILAALALASSLLFGRENRRELLLLPLGASFIVLVATVHGAAHPDVVGVMALLALWGAIYARAFLQDQFAADRTPSPLMLWATTARRRRRRRRRRACCSTTRTRASSAPRSCALSLALVLLAIVAARPLVATLAVALSALGLATVAVSVVAPRASPHRHLRRLGRRLPRQHRLGHPAPRRARLAAAPRRLLRRRPRLRAPRRAADARQRVAPARRAPRRRRRHRSRVRRRARRARAHRRHRSSSARRSRSSPAASPSASPARR